MQAGDLSQHNQQDWAKEQFWLHFLKKPSTGKGGEIRVVEIAGLPGAGPAIACRDSNPQPPQQDPTMQPLALITHLLTPFFLCKRESQGAGQKREWRKSVNVMFGAEEEGDESLIAAVGHFIKNWYGYNI